MAKILFIDDMREFLDEQMKLLAEHRFPHEVKTADNPRAALELLAQDRYDLIVLDLVVPNMQNGIELLHEIKRRFPETKVLIYSGWIEEITKQELFKSGADEILQKGCPIERFMKAIEALLTPGKDSTIVMIHGYNLKDLRNQILPVVIQKALSKTNGNVGMAADLLGITRQCLARWLKRLGIVR